MDGFYDGFLDGVLDEFGNSLLDGNIPYTSYVIYGAWCRRRFSV